MQLGSLIEHHWKYKDPEQAEKISVQGFKWIIISEADKQAVRDNIVNKMFECEVKGISKQYVRSVITMCRFDYPDKWQSLLS